MIKFYEEICLLETKNITSFDLELNYKCHVLVRKILHFLYNSNKLKNKTIKEENNLENDVEINNNSSINPNMEEKKKKDNNLLDSQDNIDTSDSVISDDKEDIIKGIININDLIVKKFKELTQDTIDKLNLEVRKNPNYKENVKKKYDEFKIDIKQIIGMINNYEVEQLTRIYDSLGSKGRPKLSYAPENITTFYERIEDNQDTD